MEEININSLLEDGKIKYRVWRNLTVEQRYIIMDDVLDEIHDIGILDEIAPSLRFDILPYGHRNIQMAYMSENRLHPRSRESEISRETFAKELKELHEKIDKKDYREERLLQVLENYNRLIHIFF